MPPQPVKGSTSRKRRPNWTDPECLLLAQLIQKKQNIVRGKQSTGVSVQDKRHAWKEIVQAINDAFPQVQRTVSDCNKKWENLLAKAREEIKRQSNKEEEMLFEKLSAVTQIVISVLNISEKKMQEQKKLRDADPAENPENSYAEDGNSTTEESTSKQALIEVELSDPDPDPDPDPDQTITPDYKTASTKIPTSPARHEDVCTDSNVQSPCSSSSSPICRPAALQEKFNLEMSVLRRQDKVLKLQEEYYALKIKLLKNQIKEFSQED
ncbi:uncharacterized protein LOC101155681 [Oryzias latipes]|uniref:uncharacterized protein LOC101155681 n=1 Tax=Oryzias latipes TaxID=8090 RepID=UPI0002A4AF43|nr:uncharacterized protein LOC101155681 [Oryzias latipes]XP_023811031.1 uncharacterized protein LOC101155681 [Oryzias latipes]